MSFQLRPYKEEEFERACQVRGLETPDAKLRFKVRFDGAGKWIDHYMHLALDNDGELIGDVQLRHCDRTMPDGVAHIGIDIAVAAQGKGAGTKALELAWDWAKVQTAPYVIKEAALLFESNAVEGLDYVIGVTAPLAIRKQRVMARDQTTQEEVEKRMRNQISDTIKMRLCDGVIVNDNVQLIIPQVLKIHEIILAKLGINK
jgi:hypothetical protein